MLRIWIRVGLISVLLSFIMVVFCRKLPNELDPDKGTSGIDIEKSTNDEDADSPTGPSIIEGGTVTWKYIVRNTGNVTLTSISVTDNREGSIGTIASLAPGSSQTLTHTGTASMGQYSNEATASCTFGGKSISDSDLSHYIGTDVPSPAIDIEKHTNDEDADSPTGPWISVGDSVKWLYMITNTGGSIISNVTVTDDVPGVSPVFKSGDDGNGVLDVGEVWTYEAAGVAVQGQYANIGTVTGRDPEDNEVTDCDSSHYHGYIDYSAFYRDSSYSVVVSMPIPSDITLPPAKLPWPHQLPGISQPAYYQHIKDLWLFDNFGTYQASDSKSYLYFHDGIDVMLPNGTKLYAIESGYVKSVRGEGTDWGCIVIGETEGDALGMGWEYAHTGNFQFQVGNYVHRGEYIADVVFLEHLHISRIRVSSGAWSDKRNREYFHSDNYFLYEDTVPPIVKTPFFYFRNNTDEPFERTYPAVVSGDVDIVVAMKDLSETCINRYPEYLTRHCVSRMEYEITGENMQPVFKRSVDFSKIIFHEWPGRMYDERVYLIYKDHCLPILQNSGLDRSFAYYIITNTDGTGEFGFLDLSAAHNAWKTADLDETGNPLFPNGVYTIKVKAYDFLGNYTVATETVVVDNS